MPAKYSIHTKPTSPRFRPVGKLGIVDWREDCSSCHNCVKRGCVYGFYRDEADTLRSERGYLDYIFQCKGCLNCVQNCTKGILTRVTNPEFNRLGDDYYTPDVIVSTWFQADTGRIPVSGSGYGGRFSGPGFDSMWTDMSEIVRPTRDGIHGREYINTSVDIGRKLLRLTFQDGRLMDSPPPLVESPAPIMFDVIPTHWRRGAVVPAVVEAGAEMGLFTILEEGDATDELVEQGKVIPLVNDPASAAKESFRMAPIVMLDDRPDFAAVLSTLKSANPNQIVAVRVAASPAVATRIVELVRDGAEVVHLVFDMHGRERGAETPRHARDVLREVHVSLTKDGSRDQVTLVASGGIALPEHMAKAIICGADMVAIDLPLMVALECRLCGQHENGEAQCCPVALEEAQPGFAVQRIVNLIGTWHQQLIEVLGAMGIREVRRLRGEVGRAMFFEDLERDSFGKLFGKRK